MPVFLKYIDMVNFISYRGHVRVGPFRPYTAIIGSSSLGKLYFMDALIFVMGGDTRLMNVQDVNHLIYGVWINKPVSNNASVTATFVWENKTEKQFQRFVIGLPYKYKIDGEGVTASQYLAELKKLGIVVNPNNFFTSLCDVIDISMHSPMETTALFEVISGSGELKQQYEWTRGQKEAYEKDLQRKQQELTELEHKWQKAETMTCGTSQRELAKMEHEADVGECSHAAQVEEVTALLGAMCIDGCEEAHRCERQEIVKTFKRKIRGVAMQELYQLRQKVSAANRALEAARERAYELELAFEKVKKERQEKFMKYCAPVANEIDAVYKALTKDQSGEATLAPKNPDEPYLDDVVYICAPPGHTVQPMPHLSDEHIFVAGLALIFAIRRCQAPPFLLLNEVETVLDGSCYESFTSYTRFRSGVAQKIVITSKVETIYQADIVFTIYAKENEEALVTNVIKLQINM